jgi:hypothetical protein
MMAVLTSKQERASQSYVEEAFPHDSVNNQTVYDPSNKAVDVQPALLGWIVNVDVTVRKDLELLLSIPAGDVDGKENWPRNAKSHKAYGAANAKESDEKV